MAFEDWVGAGISNLCVLNYVKEGDVVTVIERNGFRRRSGLVDFIVSKTKQTIIRVDQRMVAVENYSDGWLIDPAIFAIVNCTDEVKNWSQ